MQDNNRELVIYKGLTRLGYYWVIDKIYSHRPARLLYSGSILKTAQSGIALDGNPLMLFGYNQRFMELVNDHRPRSVLVIGGGVYTLPTSIVASAELIKVDVVEPNDDLDDIAAKFFDFKPSERLKVYNSYGLDYLKTNNQKYDLIIVDAYVEDHIPDKILLPDFARLIDKSLTKNGLAAINIISSLKPEAPLEIIRNNYRQTFEYLKAYPADAHQSEHYYNHNYILIAGHRDFNPDLKYQALNLEG